MARTLTSPSEENYLECIYRLAEAGPVRPSDLADKLGIKRPSVTKAVSSLVQKGLARRDARGALALTEAGQAVGRAVVRRDRCLTALLVEVLDMPAAMADAEVHRLEHVLGDDVLIRLETLVDFARSSPAWLKRLHLRVNQRPHPDSAGHEFAVGQTSVHSGKPY